MVRYGWVGSGMVKYGQVPAVGFVAEGLTRIEQKIGNSVHGVAHKICLILREARCFLLNLLEEAVLALVQRACTQIQ